MSFNFDFLNILMILEFESIGYIEPYMDSVTLLSVLPFSDSLNLFKKVGVSVIFVLFVLELKHFTPDLPGIFKLTTKLESTVPERMSTISVSHKYVYQRKYSKPVFLFTLKTLIQHTGVLLAKQ